MRKLVPHLYGAHFIIRFVLLALIFLGIPNMGFAQESSPKTFWAKINATQVRPVGEERIKPKKFETVTVDIKKLRAELINVKHRNDQSTGKTVFIDLPYPDGSKEVFEVLENNTMSPGLKEKYPQIRSYDAISKSGASAKIDITPHGFHAMIFVPGKSTIFIDPFSFGDTENYKVYSKSNFTTDKELTCAMTGSAMEKSAQKTTEPQMKFGTCQLRTYRLALAATGEYTAFHGGTQAQALAAQVTTMNRVNGMYERDMAITMEIIANNDLIVFTDAGTDPYSNGNTGNMINENQTECDNTIGNANYDIGHVFGTNSGGLAGLGVVCSDGSKARGVTGSSAPVGDPFDIDYVAHEMGHQFGANHTQNNSCNRNNGTAMEPGSASTIMGYAGICAPNVQDNSDDHFHGISLEEIHDEITSAPHSCPVITNLANNEPVISSTNSDVALTLPASTPFALTAVASDADGDVLTYQWDQMDNEISTQPPSATSVDGPNFRSNSPSTSPTRYFPNLADLAAGITPTWEVIPSVSRTMNFRVFVRDQALGTAGCNDHTDVTVSFDGGSGPFLVTYPSTTGIIWTGLTTETVTWDAGGTDGAPVSCSTVDIYLSTDGGTTYPTLLANDVPNDGSQNVTVPNLATTTARIMVMCSNGSFFDISDNDFEITMATNDFTLSVNNPSISVCPPADAIYQVNTGSVGGFTDNVSLAVSGVPAGATGTFGSTNLTPGDSTTFTVSNTDLVAAGNHTITISGTSTTGTKSVDVSLSVSGPVPSAVTLNSPTDGVIDENTPVSFAWSSSGTGDFYEIQISTDSNFTTITDSTSGLSTNSYTSSALAYGTVYYWRVRAYNACGTAVFTDFFTFETINAVLLPPTGTLTTQTECSGILYDAGGPSGAYSNSEDAQVTIAPTGASSIDLNFTFFDIEPGSNNNCDYDYLLVYDGPSTASALIGTYCNDNVPTTLSSTGGSVTIVFHSDGGVTHEGFAMEWQCQLSNVPPVADFTADVDTTCTGEVSFTDQSNNGPTSWNWDFGDGNTSTLQNPSYVYTYNGAYTVKLVVTNAFGTDSITRTNYIYVNAPTAPTAIGDTSCGPDSLVLSANGSGNLVWYDSLTGGSQLDTGSTFTTPFISTSTTYYVEAEISASSVYGAKTDFTGNGGNSKNDQHLIFDAYTNFEIVSVQVDAKGAGNRTIELRNNAGTVLDSRLVNIPDGISTVNVNFDVTPGTDYQLGIDANGTVDLYRNTNGVTYPYDLAGLGSVTGSSSGANAYCFYYNWELREPGCTSPRTAVTATIFTQPNVFAGNDTTICSGDSLVLSGSGANSYSWNNGITDGVSFVPTSGANNYIVTGTIGTCQDIDTLVVTGNSPITIDSVISINSTCGSNAGEINIYASGGSGSFTYSIDGGSSFVSNGGIFTSLGAGNYPIIVFDGNCYVSGDTITLTSVASSPAPTTSNDTTYCTDESLVAMLASGTGGTLKWYSDSALTMLIDSGASLIPTNNVGTTTYYVAETIAGCEGPASGINITIHALPNVYAGNDTTVCVGSSLTLSGSGASIYNWINGITDGSPFTVTSDSSFILNGTDVNGCTNTDTITITAQAQPTATATASVDSTCNYNTVTLIGSSSTGSGTWSANGLDGDAGLGSTTSDTTIFTPNAADNNVQITWTSNNNGVCTAANDTLDLVFFTPPTVFTGNDTTLCDGSSITLSGNGANSYSWDNGITDGVPFLVAGSGSTTYTVTGTDANGCTGSDSVVITVQAQPTTTATASVDSTCNYNTVTLIGTSSTGSGTWSANGLDGDAGLSSTTSDTTIFTPNAADNNVQITWTSNSNGVCTAANDTLDLVFFTPPTVFAGNDTTLCAGSSITLSGSGANSYSWDNGVTDGVPFLVAGSGSTTYTVTGTNANGCTGSDSVVITVQPQPTTTATASVDSTCNYNTVTLIGSSSTGSGTWSANGLDGDAGLSSTTSDTTIFTPNAADNNVQITWTSNSNGVCTAANGTLDLVFFTPPTVFAGNDTTLCAGSSITLSGSGANSYSWDNGVTDGVPFLVTGSGSTTYTVTGTDANGCTGSDQVTVTVNPLPNVDAGTNVTVCAGSFVTLSGSGANSYTWDNGVSNGTSFTASGSESTTYHVTGTDNNGCQNNDSVIVSVNSLPVIDSLNSTDITCAGNDGEITIYASGGSGTYSYSIDNGSSFNSNGGIYTGLGAGTYHIALSDGNCQVIGDSVTFISPITPSAPTVSSDTTYCDGELLSQMNAIGSSGTFNWYTDSTLTNNIGSGNTLTPSNIPGTTLYYVTETAGSCEGPYSSISITINNLPNVSAGSDTSVCSGVSLTISGSGATTYAWNNGVTDGVAFTATGSGTTTYIVTGTDLNGCSNTDTMNVTINTLPTVDAGVNVTVCSGSDVTLSGAGATMYTWDNGISDGVPFSTSGSGTTIYTVTGTDLNGCQNTDTVSVTVFTVPTVYAGNDTSLCSGATMTFSGSGATSYSWSNGVSNGVTTNISGSGLQAFIVTGTNGNGCTDTDTVNVQVHALPNVSAGPNQSVCEGEGVILNGSGATTLAWNNGVSNGTEFVQNIIGLVEYILTGTDSNGCSNIDTTVVTVLVTPDSTVEVIDGILTAQAGYTYQWLDCENNMQPIDGEINQELSADLNGSFAVIVSNGNCSNTSFCHTQGNTGISGSQKLVYTIWPNPSSGDFHLQLNDPTVINEVKVYDGTGRLVLQIDGLSDTITKLDLNEQPTGMYMVVLTGKASTETTRIVKE